MKTTLATNRHELTRTRSCCSNLFEFVRACSCLFVVLLSVLVYFSQAAEAQSSMEFYRELARKPEATVGDAVHAVARYKGYTGHTSMWEELEFLDRYHGIRFKRNITRMDDHALTKGNASHMILSAMGVKGWVMRRIFKGSQRYALREAIYLKLLPAESTLYQKMSGGELMGFLARVVEMTEGQNQ